MLNNHRYGVILAGGKGERLWPLSRERFPKQFLTLFQKTLFEHTRDRLADPALAFSSIYTVVTEQYAHLVTSYLPQEQCVVEPALRNTAPAILLSCLQLYAKDPEAQLIFVPADHFIQDQQLFQKAVAQAMTVSAVHHKITLLGVKPTTPATGYGYIESNVLDEHCSQVVRFHEKPTHEQAIEYLQRPSMLWNVGIFCGKASLFIQEFKALCPELFEKVFAYMQTGDLHHYTSIAPISIDYALMEKSAELLVIPAHFDWSDVGNLETFLSLEQLHQADSKNVCLEANNNLVMAGDILTVLIGVDNLCVIRTDDVLLIAQRKDVEKVKQAVHQLRHQKREDHL